MQHFWAIDDVTLHFGSIFNCNKVTPLVATVQRGGVDDRGWRLLMEGGPCRQLEKDALPRAVELIQSFLSKL